LSYCISHHNYFSSLKFTSEKESQGDKILDIYLNLHCFIPQKRGGEVSAE